MLLLFSFQIYFPEFQRFADCLVDNDLPHVDYLIKKPVVPHVAEEWSSFNQSNSNSVASCGIHEKNKIDKVLNTKIIWNQAL